MVYKNLLWLLPAVLLFTTACELENPEVGVSADDIIVLSTEEGKSNQLLADGVDRLQLIAELGPLADANSVITFSSERGSFAEAVDPGDNIVSIQASGKRAEATLISSTDEADEVIISAQVGDFLVTDRVAFVRAFPTDLILEAEKQLITADRIDFAEVTITLVRDIGQPSANAKVFLSQETLIDAAEMELPPFVFTDGQTAQVQVRSKNGQPGEARLIVTVLDEDGNEIERSLDFVFE